MIAITTKIKSMRSRILVFIIANFFFNLMALAQNGDKDPVLFTVAGNPVPVSEFIYIYDKTNGDKADYSKSSLEEYLDLYIKFKLKVQRAREMKLDTIPDLIDELAGYRKQLANSYLTDRQVTEKLVKEAYEHMQQDVDISYIMVKFGVKTSPNNDTLAAYQKINEAKQKLEKGESFAKIARAYSDDESVVINDGHIGFVTALFPNGYYNLEKAAYTLPLGTIHGPIRTKDAYFLLLIHKRRAARGEMEVAHILARNDKSGDEVKARLRMDSIYQRLEAGESFEDLAKAYSDDKVTGPKGGYIGFFGINRYENSFEDAAFSISEDGQYTRPVPTSIGWHIIKRISKRDNSFEYQKARLQNKIKKFYRFEQAKKRMIERIKKEGNFMQFNTTLKKFTDSLDQNFLTYKWKAPKGKSKDILFVFGNKMKVSLNDFTKYLQQSSRKRQRMGQHASTLAVALKMYQDFVSENAIKFEERQLEVKYPEFKSLMREYEEGILLFEATKRKVWDKASSDTLGLEAFYEKMKENYSWKERAVVSQYSLKKGHKQLITEARDFASKNPRKKVLEHFNANEKQKILFAKEKTIEKGRNEVLDKMTWEVGALSPTEISKRDQSYNFLKIEKVLPPAQKSLKEGRGYVVADYQDYLEEEWVKKLRSDYKVEVNEKVFENLIRK